MIFLPAYLAIPSEMIIWYLKENINPAAAALATLDQIFSRDEYAEKSLSPDYAARLDLIRERLRLLYVAITRAKRELIITWNTGKNNDLKAAEPLKLYTLIGKYKKPITLT
jgi:DNA helicase-2/ATP-dependent DNA helicase PcrA